MKFKTTVNELKKAFGVLYPIINYNHSVLPYRYVLIRKYGDKIEFKAYDDYTVGSSFVSIYDEKEADAVSRFVLAKNLIALINSFSSGEISFEATDEMVIVKKGKSKYKLQLLDRDVAGDFLAKNDIDYYGVEVGEHKVKVKQFASAFLAVNHCLSKDDAQRNLQNVFIFDNKMLACDGTKGAIVEFKAKGIDKIMLHKKACDCIMNVKTSDDINLMYDGDKMYGATDDLIFVTTVDTDYPYEKIKDIIDQFHSLLEKDEFAIQVKMDPDEIADKLGRVLMFADTDTNSVSVSVTGEEMSLVVHNKSAASETVNIFDNMKNKDFSLFVDGKSLKECLMKSVSGSKWYSFDAEEMQYIYDGSLLQFFLGLSS